MDQRFFVGLDAFLHFAKLTGQSKDVFPIQIIKTLRSIFVILKLAFLLGASTVYFIFWSWKENSREYHYQEKH